LKAKFTPQPDPDEWTNMPSAVKQLHASKGGAKMDAKEKLVGALWLLTIGAIWIGLVPATPAIIILAAITLAYHLDRRFSAIENKLRSD
jgi:hypothetical protein